MNCAICKDTGVVAKDLGMGICSFGPCLECNIHLLNTKRVEQERQDMLARKSMVKSAKETSDAHLLARRRKSRLPDWNLWQPERM